MTNCRKLTQVERETTVYVETVMSSCSLDWQRLPGQEARPVDVVVRLRREVDNLQVAVSRLEDRPPGERGSHWDVDAIRD